MSAQEKPLVLLLTEDLLFGTRLQDTLKAGGYRCQLVDQPAQLEAEGDVEARPVPLTEPLSGADAGFMRSLSERQPALVLVDMSAQQLPWHRWIQIMKTSATSRRIPILAFGPHVDKASFELAENAGADRVVPRGLVAKKLLELTEELARRIDWQALETACQQPPSELAQRGIDLHNQGEYYEAHEYLEEAWMAEPGEAGYLYRALLQVTVTYLHLERGNQRGAIKMLLRLRQWLDVLPDRCRGVRVEQLRQHVEIVRQAVQDLPPDSIGDFDRSLLQPFPMEPDRAHSAD